LGEIRFDLGKTRVRESVVNLREIRFDARARESLCRQFGEAESERERETFFLP